MLTNPNHLVRELQPWLDLSLNTKELKDKQYKHFIWRINKLIMKTSINSNTSLDCLHSKDVVLHIRPDLLENMLQCQLLRWYGRVLPNLVITFPKLDSLQRPQLYVIPGHQELKVSILHWHHNLASVSIDSKSIEPSHFPFSLQSSPNSLSFAHHFPRIEWTGSWCWETSFQRDDSLSSISHWKWGLSSRLARRGSIRPEYIW